MKRLSLLLILAALRLHAAVLSEPILSLEVQTDHATFLISSSHASREGDPIVLHLEITSEGRYASVPLEENGNAVAQFLTRLAAEKMDVRQIREIAFHVDYQSMVQYRIMNAVHEAEAKASKHSTPAEQEALIDRLLFQSDAFLGIDEALLPYGLRIKAVSTEKKFVPLSESIEWKFPVPFTAILSLVPIN